MNIAEIVLKENHLLYIKADDGQTGLFDVTPLPRIGSLRAMLAKLHMLSAKAVNQMDDAPGRKVWFQYWDSLITYERSYLARLQYVHQNAVHHRIMEKAEEYLWCSAGWFTRHAPAAFAKTVQSCRTDKVNVYDAF